MTPTHQTRDLARTDTQAAFTEPAALPHPDTQGPGSLRGTLAAALDSAAFTVPLSLGAAALVFASVHPSMLAGGVMATLLGLALLQLVTLADARPMMYAARFFEAATLATLMGQLWPALPSLGLPDTLGVRLACLVLVLVLAALMVGLLYLVRADRFSRFIPAPVFAGFANAIALILLIHQGHGLLNQLRLAPAVWVVLLTAAVAAVVAVGVRWRWPRWPAAALGLAAGLVCGALAGWAGAPLPTVSASGVSWVLPLAQADFAALAADTVNLSALAGQVLPGAAVLAGVMFINTTVSAQMVSHSDDRPPTRMGAGLLLAGGMAGAAVLGAAPLSGSAQSTLVAMRTVPGLRHVPLMVAVVIVAVAASGVLAWIPLAAVAAVLLVEGWYMADQPSLRTLAQWLRRQPLSPEAREDLALMATVAASGVLLNMVAAVLIGLVFGLVLFAARHAARPVRQVLSGRSVSSNCARSRADLATLAREGDAIRVFELGEDLFFGAADSLQRVLREQSAQARVVVFDWSHARHVDSSMVLVLGKLERRLLARGVACMHGGLAQGSALAHLVAQDTLVRDIHPDLDRALEAAENRLLQSVEPAGAQGSTTLMDLATLFSGLDSAQRERLEARMQQRIVPAGQTVFSAGEPSDSLMVVLQGSASIVVPAADGTDVRLAGVRRGATLGEVGFLDGAPRSATVTAGDTLQLAVLSRADFEALAREEPALVQRLLTNLALDVATRLRHTNRLAIARHRAR